MTVTVSAAKKQFLPLSPLARRKMISAALEKARIRKAADDKACRGDFGIKYNFWGHNRTIQEHIFQAVILSGPADTGKTLAWLYRINQLCWQYPGAQITVVRKVANDLAPTVLQTFIRKILLPTDGVTIYGGERSPRQFVYPNGSVIWTGGLDKASKVLSSERDVIYVNQAEELILPEWETLLTRVSGRAGNMPFGMLCGDCNPGPPTHWIRQSQKAGKLVFLETSHKDNPEIYDPETGEITEAGRQRIGALEQLTGVTRDRLLHGLWVLPAGAIYEAFREDLHKVQSFDPPLLWPRVVGIDPYGDYVAAVWLAYDARNRLLNIYREYYEPFGVTTPKHAENILALSGYNPDGSPTAKAETIAAWIGGGPSERQQRLDYSYYGIPLIPPPVADVWIGIDRVIQLLEQRAIVIHDCCVNLLNEIGAYRRKVVKGQVTDEIESKAAFHLLDALRYAAAWLLEPMEDTRLTRFGVRIGNY